MKSDRRDQNLVMLFRKLALDVSVILDSYLSYECHSAKPVNVQAAIEYMFDDVDAEEAIAYIRDELPKVGKAFDAYLERGEAMNVSHGSLRNFDDCCDSYVDVVGLHFDYDPSSRRPISLRESGTVGRWPVPHGICLLLEPALIAVRYATEREVAIAGDLGPSPYRKELGTVIEDRTAVGHIVRVMRTLLYFFYKLEEDPSEEQVAEAIQRFDRNEDRVRIQWYDSPSYQRRAEIAQRLADRIFGSFPRLGLLFKHGPGSVATGERNDEKWHMKRYSRALHQILPWYESIGGIRSSDVEANIGYLVKYWEIDWVQTWTSKVVFVPKDSRGPRTICAEALELQYIQQGVARKVVETLERHPITRGRINFTDQTINQELALRSAKPEEPNMGTIDMKDASDLVSWKLVSMLFPKGLAEILAVTRSTAVTFPSGEVYEIEKYAPMGSALCFPVESFVFWSIAVAAIALEGVSVREAATSVFVYGDDLIVPVQYIDAVASNLEAFGLLVNHDKSCYRGFFRESCGVDSYLGRVVTPQRIKKKPPVKRSDGDALIAWAAYADQLYWAGCSQASEFAEQMLTSVAGAIPTTKIQQPFLSFVRGYDCFDGHRTRWNALLCTLEVYSWAVKPKALATPLDGSSRLLRSLTTNLEDTDPDRYVVRNATLTTRRWNPVHH